MRLQIGFGACLALVLALCAHGLTPSSPSTGPVVDELARLAGVPKAWGRPTLVVIAVSYSFRLLGLNSLRATQRFNAPASLLCLDEQTVGWLQQYNISCPLVVLDDEPFVPTDTNIHSNKKRAEQLSRLWALRMHVVAGLLARNIDVFVLDADAVWNQDVLAYLAGIRRLYAPEIGHEQGPDIVGQRGSFPQALGEATLGSTLCGGMIFFRASPAVAQLFDVIAHHMDMFEYDDQVAVNALLFQAAGGQQLAPLRKHKHNAMPIPDHWIWLTPSENQDLSPTALHLNYVDSRQLALARVIPSSAKLGHEIVMRLQANITVGYLPHSAFPRRCPTEINSDELVAIHCFGDTSSSRYNRLVALDLWFLDSSP